MNYASFLLCLWNNVNNSKETVSVPISRTDDGQDTATFQL